MNMKDYILIDENGDEIKEGVTIEVDADTAEKNGAHEDHAHDEESEDERQ